MYKLTFIMMQNLTKYLKEFHKLFSEGRCSSWQLEELIVKSIKQDLNNTDIITWKGNNHTKEYDILINKEIKIQIKSGEIKNNHLVISGY